MTVEYLQNEQYVQGIFFNGTINSVFNIDFIFGLDNLKITGVNTIGIIMNDLFFANNSGGNYVIISFYDISIFSKNDSCAIFFQENSSVMFLGNYNTDFLLNIMTINFNFIYDNNFLASPINFSAIYFGSSFIFQNNIVAFCSFYVQKIYCNQYYIAFQRRFLFQRREFNKL